MTEQQMTVREFFDYVLRCQGSRDLGLQLAWVHDQRAARVRAAAVR